MYREGWAGVEPQTRVCLRSPSSPGREKCVLLWFECFSLSGVCDVTDCWCIWSNLQLHKTKFSCFQTLLMLTNDCPGCCLLLLSYLTCTSSTFLFPYWAERLGEWWARHWPWAALAPLQVCVLGGVGGGGVDAGQCRCAHTHPHRTKTHRCLSAFFTPGYHFWPVVLKLAFVGLLVA